MKKTLLIVLIALSVVSILSFSMSGEASALTERNFNYTVRFGEATITGMTTGDYFGTLKVPSSLGGYPVTSIGDRAFNGYKSLINVELPDAVKSIGKEAFYECVKLKSVKFGTSLTSIGSHAFYGCSALENFDFPEKLTDITNDSFYRTAWFDSQPDGPVYAGNVFYKYKGDYDSRQNVKKLEIREGTVAIAAYAFSSIEGLTEVTLPSSLKVVGPGAFWGLEYLKEIAVPASVERIGESVFSNCSSLEKISVESGNTAYSGAGNCLVELSSGKLIGGCKNSVIPDDGTVKEICNNAFYGCRGLTEIVIPNGVRKIGENAFFSCNKLYKAVIPPTVTEIGRYSFAYCHSLRELTFPDSVTTVGTDAFKDSGSGYYTVENGIKYVGKVACEYIGGEDAAVALLTFKEGTLAIAGGAFRWCEDVRILSVPDSVKVIGDDAFESCTNLSSVSLGKNVEKIGRGAFSGCSALKKLVLPDSLKTVGGSAFNGANDIADITFGKGLTEVGTYAFSWIRWYNDQPQGPVYTGNVFYDHKGTIPSEFEIKDGTVGVADYAFANTSGLKEVFIPESVVFIGKNAFNNRDVVVLKGYKGSYAEKYAAEKGLEFKAIYPEYGDADGNGTVNALDVVRLKRYFAEMDKVTLTSPVEVGALADANADGKISALDLIRVKRILAGLYPPV